MGIVWFAAIYPASLDDQFFVVIYLAGDFLNSSIWAVVWSIVRHVKDEKSESSHEASHVNEPYFHDGSYETNKVVKFS